MEPIYYLMYQARYAGRNGNAEEYQRLNAELQQALDALTDADITASARHAHPILHESANQLTSDYMIGSCFETFKIIWCHPKLKHLWADRNYLDKYRLLAEERLSRDMCKDTNRPEVKWIMETIKVRPVKDDYDIYIPLAEYKIQ